MLSEAILDKAPADLAGPFFTATTGVFGGIQQLRDNGLELEESGLEAKWAAMGRDGEVDYIRKAVAGWESIADDIAKTCYKLARDLQEVGHYFAGVNSGAVSFTVPLGGMMNGGPWDNVDNVDLSNPYRCDRVVTAPSWHHVMLGVGHLLFAEIQKALWRFDDVLRQHTEGDSGTTHAVVYTYDDTVGNEDILPITLGVGYSEREPLELQLEQELQRAWGTWFPSGSNFTAFGDWPEEEKDKAKSPFKAKDNRTPEERNVAVREYLKKHGNREKKVTLAELATELGCTQRAAHETDAWTSYNADWEKQYGKCRTRNGKGRRPGVTELTEEELRRIAEEQAANRDKVGRYDHL